MQKQATAASSSKIIALDLLLGLTNHFPCAVHKKDAQVPSVSGIGMVPSDCTARLIPSFLCLSFFHSLIAPVKFPDQS